MDRIAILAGRRTPFARPGAAYAGLAARDLGALVVRELVIRAEIDPRAIGLVVFGQSAPSADAPNVAREIVLRAGLPRSIEAFTVVRGCASSLQAMTSAAEAILTGDHDVAVVGGVDVARGERPALGRTIAAVLEDALRSRAPLEALRAGLARRDAAPFQEKEPWTGLSMGEHAERMAKDMGVTRREQDRFAHRSHARAAAAWHKGTFAPEVVHVVAPPAFDRPMAEDEAVHARPTLEAYAALPPLFDAAHGSVTAGNSSPAADGACALVLARESKARALGIAPLGYLRAWAYAAVDPDAGLLMGPAHATPRALDRARLRLADVDLVEMHEAFAAQVLCNTKALASRRFAEDQLGRSTGPVGEIDDERLNVNGGSIAMGHPPAATGARMVHSLLRELRRRGGRFGLATASAAGGLGASVVLEMA